jgi:hypothetical protein
LAPSANRRPLKRGPAAKRKISTGIRRIRGRHRRRTAPAGPGGIPARVQAGARHEAAFYARRPRLKPRDSWAGAGSAGGRLAGTFRGGASIQISGHRLSSQTQASGLSVSVAAISAFRLYFGDQIKWHAVYTVAVGQDINDADILAESKAHCNRFSNSKFGLYPIDQNNSHISFNNLRATGPPLGYTLYENELTDVFCCGCQF